MFGRHWPNGGRRRSPTARSAAAAARTSGKRREGWSARRLCTGMMLNGSSPRPGAEEVTEAGDWRWRRLIASESKTLEEGCNCGRRSKYYTVTVFEILKLKKVLKLWLELVRDREREGGECWWWLTCPLVKNQKEKEQRRRRNGTLARLVRA